MEVTVKLATREGAAHNSGVVAGFILLAQRGEINAGFPMPKATVMGGVNINF